jgi:hypothetical protein
MRDSFQRKMKTRNLTADTFNGKRTTDEAKPAALRLRLSVVSCSLSV